MGQGNGLRGGGGGGSFSFGGALFPLEISAAAFAFFGFVILFAHIGLYFGKSILSFVAL
jgi:hypothetical protein